MLGANIRFTCFTSGRHAAKLLLSTHKLQGASPKSIVPLPKQQRFKHILWGIEIKQMGRCCVCIYHAQGCYTLCRATALLFHPNSPPLFPSPPNPIILPCRVLQRGESSQKIVFCLPEPPDSVSLSLESAASFCPHCTSFRKERKEGWLTLFTSIINKYLLCTETMVSDKGIHLEWK